jgi:hypothetical protein
VGAPDQLNGFAEFSAESMLARLHELMLGEYPALTQCVMFQKPR